MHTTLDYGALQAQYELDVFGKRGITLVAGEGATLIDDEGNRYIDALGGQGSVNLGHAHPLILAAINEQASRLLSCPGAFANDIRATYLEALVAAAPASLTRAFLCNSGTESVEAAIKFSRVTTGRPRIVAARRGFHGRTYGAMSATFNPVYRKGCGPIAPGFEHVTYNDEAALEAVMGDDVAGVILEIVQGEGGVRPATASFLEAARRLCDEHGAMLIIDEVQTGFGRTGKLFACEHFDLQPDVLCLAKSIASGVPMGATLVSDKVNVPIGRHGTTFGGNPLACAAAAATLEVMQRDGIPERAAALGAALVNRLQEAELSQVKEIRALGLMIGIELKGKAKPLLKALLDEGIIALTAGPTVLRLLPPLVIEEDALDRIATVLIRHLR